MDDDTVSTAPVRQGKDAYEESYRPDVCRKPLGIELAEVPQVEVSQDRINLRGGREPLNPLLSQWAPTDAVGERSIVDELRCGQYNISIRRSLGIEGTYHSQIPSV